MKSPVLPIAVGIVLILAAIFLVRQQATGTLRQSTFRVDLLSRQTPSFQVREWKYGEDGLLHFVTEDGSTHVYRGDFIITQNLKNIE